MKSLYCDVETELSMHGSQDIPDKPSHGQQVLMQLFNVYDKDSLLLLLLLLLVILPTVLLLVLL